MRIRVFLAVNFSVPVTRRIAEEVERRKASLSAAPHDGLQIAWVPAANYHLTLQFVGGIDEELLEGMAVRLKPVARAIEPFELRARGVGQFPEPPKAARVLWVGVEGTSDKATGALKALQRQVVTALEGLGVALPDDAHGKAPYHPHLTVGRVKDGRLPEGIWTGDAELGTSLVRELVIYESAHAVRPAGPGEGESPHPEKGSAPGRPAHGPAHGVEYRPRVRLPLGAAPVAE